jgi:hypothetical protein
MFSSELLVFAAIVAAFMAFNAVVSWLARKAREAREREIEPARTQPTAVEPLLDHAWGGGAPVRAAEELTRSELTVVPHSVPAATSVLESRKSRQIVRVTRRLRTQQGVREAIVLMTVLEPCRALEPYSTQDQAPWEGSRN